MYRFKVMSLLAISMLVSLGCVAISRLFVSTPATQIVFSSNRSGNLDIFYMGGNESTITQLTTNPANDQFPAVSPDGEHIAFTSDRDGSKQIYLLDSSINNSKAQEASVKGRFISQRKGTKENWEDYYDLSFSKLRTSEWSMLDLNGVEVLALYKRLGDLY